MHREIGVDVEVVLERQRSGHAVAEVGGGRHALHPGRRLTVDHRHLEPDPHLHRTRVAPRTGREAVLAGVAVERGAVAGGERHPLDPSRRHRRHRRVDGEVRVVGQRDGLGAHPQRTHAGHLRAGVAEHPGDERHLPPGSLEIGVERQRPTDRNRTRELDGEAGDLPGTGVGVLHGASEEGGNRPAVAVARVPRTAAQRSGHPVAAVGVEQCGRLGRHRADATESPLGPPRRCDRVVARPSPPTEGEDERRTAAVTPRP